MTDHLRMTTESFSSGNSIIDRISSFASVRSNLTPTICAAAGFANVLDKIQCRDCFLEVPDGFDASQSLSAYHKNASVNCSFIKRLSQDPEDSVTVDEVMNEGVGTSIDLTDNGNEIEPMHEEVSISNPYKDEKKRFMTLSKSKNFSKRASELAKAGFYLISLKIEVIRCFACSVNIPSLKPNDNPHAIHQQLNPECPFVNGKEVGNIPFSKIQNFEFHSEAQKNVPGMIDEYNFQPQVKHPEMMSLPSRLQTFTTYPGNVPMTASSLAEAGLFYQGHGDQVTCFQCGLFIKKWNIDDDPWIEHARWNQSCPFVLKKKGKSFVKQSINFVHALEEQKRQSGVQAGLGKAGDDNIEAGVRLESTHATIYSEKEDIPAPVTTFLKGEVVADALIMGYSFILVQHAILKYWFEYQEFPNRFELISLLIEESEAVPKKEPMKEIEQDFKRMKMTSANEDLSMCSICYERPPCILFLGCGHLTTCEVCSASSKLLTCPICRVIIKGTVKVYFS